MSRTRLQLEVSDATKAAIEAIANDTGLGSPSQVVRAAVQLLEGLLRDQRQGLVLCIVHADGRTERLRLVF